MADVRAIASFTELSPFLATFKYDNTIVADTNRYDLGLGSAQVGMAVVQTATAQTVGLGSNGGYPLGKLIKVEADGFCTVQYGGVMALPYSGTAPTVGRGINVDGAGNAIAAAGGTRAATERGIVHDVDTVNHFVFVSFVG